MMDKLSNAAPFDGGVHANLEPLGKNPDYVRAMVKITNCIVQGRFHEGVYYPVEGPESASESESEEELPSSLSSTPSSQQQQQQLQQQLQQQQQQLQLQDTALQFYSVAFKAQQHKQHMQQQQQLLQQHQQHHQRHQKEQTTSAICATVLDQQPPPPNSIVSKKLKKSETVHDFAEKYWRETQKLNRVFEDEDCFLVSNHKSSKNLSNLGRVLHTTPRRHHSSRTEHKPQSDEPKGIALYLQPINHDLTFKTNSTVDKSTQI